MQPVLQVSMVLMVQPAPRVPPELLASRDCKAYKAFKDLQALLVQLAQQVQQVQQAIQG